VSALVHHAILGVGVAGLLGAGWRVADRAAPEGLARVVAAAVVAVALAVLEALALGLVGAADSSVVLALAALATYGVAFWRLPRPRLGALAELSDWWSGAGRPVRAVTGAGVVLFAGWVGWQLRHPFVGPDGLTYHLPLAASWAQSGHAGRLIDTFQGIPVANYPVTNEVAIGWVIALSHSWVVASVWTPVLAAVLVGGAVLGLRALRVPPLAIAAAIVAFLLQPIALTQLGTPLTDFACAAWLVAAGGLCAAGRERPALLPIALVAAGLSFGTKTTGAILLLAALVAAGYAARATLRRLPRWWALAVPAALGVGGIWVTRNLILHGSPLWPFVSGPGGDPVPPALAAVNDSFLQHPRAMLSGRVDDYAKLLAGGVLLLAGGVLAPLAARSRPVLLAAGAALVALFAWAAAPYTGIDTSTDLAIGATRYLLPTLVACALAIALAARDARPEVRYALIGLLGVAAVLSAARTWKLGYPYVPGIGTAVALAAVGAIAGGALPSLPRVVWRAAGVAVPVAAVVVLAVASSGYVRRHAGVGLADGGLLRAAAALPGFKDESFDIAMGPATDALIRGDHLRHEVVFLGGSTPCATVRARAQTGWVVLQQAPISDAYRHLFGCLAGRTPRWQDGHYQLYAG
jgi:hypothetical protein